MKYKTLLSAISLFCFIAPHSQASDNAYTTFHYGGSFTAQLPTKTLENSKVAFTDDSNIIFFESGQSLSGGVILRETDNLPEDFDLSKYPAYILGLEDPENLDVETKERFINSAKLMRQDAEVPVITSHHLMHTLYSSCGFSLNKEVCTHFLVENKQNHSILMMSSTGFERSHIVNLLQLEP